MVFYYLIGNWKREICLYGLIQNPNGFQMLLRIKEKNKNKN